MKSMVQILWKRNKLWIILVVLLGLIMQGLGARFDMELTEKSLKESAVQLAWYKDHEEVYFDSSDPEGMKKEYKALKADMEKDWGEGFSKKSLEELQTNLDLVREKYHLPLPESDQYSSRTELEYEVQELYNHLNYLFSRTYEDRLLEAEHFSVDGTGLIFENISGNIILAMILSLLFTSFEHLTSYDAFTGSFPWSKTKSYGTKIFLGLGILLIFFLSSVGISYGIMVNSQIAQVLSFSGFFETGVMVLLRVLAFFGLMMGIGALAGNFIGHFGLAIIALGGVELWLYILRIFCQTIFGYLSNSHPITQWQIWVDNLADFWQMVLVPIHISDSDLSWKGLAAFFLVAFLWMLAGLFWIRKDPGDRRGLFVMPKPLSFVAEFLAITTLTSLLTDLFAVTIFQAGSVQILIYVLILYLAYRIFRPLFRVRLGI